MKKLIIFLLFCGMCFAQKPNLARMLSGVNAQTGTSYTFLQTDVTQVVSFNNALPVAVTLPNPTTPGLGFSAGTIFTTQNLGAGTVTITCSGCTINLAASLPLLTGQGADIYSDGTNYTALSTGAGSGIGTLTGVIAGPGLSGGGTTGSPTLKFQDCPINQVQQSGGPGTWNCAAVAASPGAPANSIQFNLSGGFSGDSFFSYNSGTHTQTVQNQSITGTQTFAGPYVLDSVIPGVAPTVGAAGHSGIAANTDGSFCMWVNGGPCNDIATGTGSLVSLAPVGAQSVVQPAGTTLNVNTLNGARIVTPSFNWLQSPAADLSAAGAKTVTLTPCPSGVIAADTNLWVYIAAQGTPEAVNVTGGTCTSGAASGTIVFTTVNAHAAGYTVGSASSGIYEALRDATPTDNNNAHIIFPPSNPGTSVYYTIYAPVTIVGRDVDMDGHGALIDCQARRACFVTSTTSSGPNHVHGFRIATRATYANAAITQTACAANVSTITTTLNPLVGEYVDVQATFDNRFWGIHKVVASSGSSWTYTDTNCSGATTIAAQTTIGGNGYEFAFLETTGQGTQVDHIDQTRPAGGGFQNNTFNNTFVILNDQSFHLHDIQITNGVSGCTSTYCANLVYAPGPFNPNPAVIYADHINGTLSCTGNGFTLYNGNTAHISDAVIQGFSEWGIVSGPVPYKGGFGPTTLTNVYEELGSCTNPNYPGSGAQARAAAGALIYGNSSIRGGEAPIGQMPQYANTGNGLTQYNYFLIVKDTGGSNFGPSAPLRCGYASVDSVTPTGSITVACPRVNGPPGGADVITYDLLRVAGAGNNLVSPYIGGCAGGSTTACGSVLTAQAQCSTAVCSFTDTASASTTSYAVPTATYYPYLNFWPGGLILSASDTNIIGNAQLAKVDSLAFITNVSPIISTVQNVPVVTSPMCDVSTPGVFVSCMAGNQVGNNAVTGSLFQTGSTSGSTANLKGRINIISPLNTQTGDLITFVDSAPYKTLNSPFFRPTNDANDTAACLDSGNAGFAVAQLCFRAPVAISNYIGVVPDGTSWLERLTASLKTFKVPITTNSQVTSTLADGTAPFIVASQTRVSNLKTGGNPLVISCGTTTTCAATTLLNSFVVEGSVALTAGSASMTAMPFTNTNWICTTNDVTTIANPSKLVQTGNTTGTVTGTGTDVINFHCAGN